MNKEQIVSLVQRGHSLVAMERVKCVHWVPSLAKDNVNVSLVVQELNRTRLEQIVKPVPREVSPMAMDCVNLVLSVNTVPVRVLFNVTPVDVVEKQRIIFNVHCVEQENMLPWMELVWDVLLGPCLQLGLVNVLLVEQDMEKVVVSVHSVVQEPIPPAQDPVPSVPWVPFQVVEPLLVPHVLVDTPQLPMEWEVHPPVVHVLQGPLRGKAENVLLVLWEK